MTYESDSDVVVVGAGLAGLQCARDLHAAGLAVCVVEAGSQAGGRVSTESMDGFLLDKGFQVLNPAYPAVRRWLDVAALQLQTFGAGIGVRDGKRMKVVADPVREPRHLIATLRSGYVSPRALASAVRWLGPTLISPARTKRDSRDLPLSQSLDRAGFTQALRREVLDTFMAGVLVESEGSTSAAFAKLLLRMFALAKPGLPAHGMTAIAQQMAAALPHLRLNSPATQITHDSGGATVTTPNGRHRARAVVVAVDPKTCGELLDIPTPAMKGLVTWWFAADEAPSRLPFLLIDADVGRGAAGPVINTCVVSNAAPTYALDGRHLIQATCLMDRPGAGDDEGEVRRHLEKIYRRTSRGWQVLRKHRIPGALPAQHPPLSLRRPVRLDDRLFVCGDHRDTASIQGALVSGQRAARSVRAVLATS